MVRFRGRTFIERKKYAHGSALGERMRESKPHITDGSRVATGKCSERRCCGGGMGTYTELSGTTC